MQIGFIGKTPRGRVATRKAYEHLNIPFTGKSEFEQLKLDNELDN
jgi:Holliday junction DNA helicase RuvB